MGKVFINDLVVRGIIGVNDSERESPQEIVINLGLFTDLRRAGATDDIADCIDYQLVAEKVMAHAESARRFTVEALAADIARIGLGSPVWSEYSSAWRSPVRSVPAAPSASRSSGHAAIERRGRSGREGRKPAGIERTGNTDRPA